MLKYHIQTIELTSAQSTISFNSIPQDYTDLYVLISSRISEAALANATLISFNQVTSGFTSRFLEGNGASAYSATFDRFLGNSVGSSATANTFSNVSLYIPNYTSNANKSYSVDSVTENNGTTAYATLITGLWSNTASISSITFTPLSSYVAGTSISLYGVKRGSDGSTGVTPTAQGGTVTTSGGYTIHTFNSSGTFRANRPLDVEYIVVGGGGGGGGNASGGGGAGGFIAGSLKIQPESYLISVGSGGVGGTTSESPGVDGSNSFVFEVTSFGGGGGGSISPTQSFANGRNGGSGGGGGTGFNTTQVRGFGGNGIDGQGFAGGSGQPTDTMNVDHIGGGGGGGSSSAGGNSSTATGGNGGLGTTSSITGSSLAYSGGGGGGIRNGTIGTGGSGVGGNGGSWALDPQNGATNRGGGGGGGRNSATTLIGGNGGSGVVIIRYLTP
jgi:hypothetical protein